jgi:hypothetical protein
MGCDEEGLQDKQERQTILAREHQGGIGQQSLQETD